MRFWHDERLLYDLLGIVVSSDVWKSNLRLLAQDTFSQLCLELTVVFTSADFIEEIQADLALVSLIALQLGWSYDVPALAWAGWRERSPVAGTLRAFFRVYLCLACCDLSLSVFLARVLRRLRLIDHRAIVVALRLHLSKWISLKLMIKMLQATSILLKLHFFFILDNQFLRHRLLRFGNVLLVDVADELFSVVSMSLHPPTPLAVLHSPWLFLVASSRASVLLSYSIIEEIFFLEWVLTVKILALPESSGGRLQFPVLVRGFGDLILVGQAWIVWSWRLSMCRIDCLLKTITVVALALLDWLVGALGASRITLRSPASLMLKL